MTFDSIGPSVAVQSPRILVRIIPVPVVQSRYDCRQRRRSIQPLVLFFPLLLHSLSLPLSHRKSRPNSSPVARSMIEKVSRIVPRVFVSSRPENVDHSPPLQIKHFRYRGTDVSSTLVDKHRLVQILSFLFFFFPPPPGPKERFRYVDRRYNLDAASIAFHCTAGRRVSFGERLVRSTPLRVSVINLNSRNVLTSGTGGCT